MTSTGPSLRSHSTAGEASRVCSASPCLFFSGTVMNKSAGTDYYLQLHDAASLPANGALPLQSKPVGGGGDTYIEFVTGMILRTGCVLALSSTFDTLTVAVAADGLFMANFG